MNQTIYIQVDDQNYVSDFKLQPVDDYTEITVPLSWIADFMKYPTKFSAVDGILKSPGNLPSVSTDDLKAQLDEAMATVKAQNETVAKQAGVITQLQTLAGQLTGQQASLTNQLTEATATIQSLQGLTAQLTGQIAKINVSTTTE